MKRNYYKRYFAAGLTTFLAIAAAILLFFVIYHWRVVWGFVCTVSYILRPIFYGLVLAFLLLPIQRWFYSNLCLLVLKTRTPKVKNNWLLFLATMLSLVFAFILIYILLALVIPQLYHSVAGLIDAFPGYVSSIQGRLAHFFEKNPEIQEIVLRCYNSVVLSAETWFDNEMAPNMGSAADMLDWLQESVLPNVTGVVSSVSAILISLLYLLKDLLIAVIASVYLLMRKDIFAAQSKKLVYSALPTKWADFVVEETRSAYRIMGGFINGKLLDSLIIGIIALFCCNIFNFPYPELLATIIGVTNVIPFFGPFIGAIPCALLVLLVSPMQCLYFVLFVLVLQQFDGNILGPKILGDSTGLASFWVLFSILLFGGLFGFAGMVLGVPVFAMIYSLLSRLVRYGLRKRGLPENTDEYNGKIPALAQKEE